MLVWPLFLSPCHSFLHHVCMCVCWVHVSACLYTGLLSHEDTHTCQRLTSWCLPPSFLYFLRQRLTAPRAHCFSETGWLVNSQAQLVSALQCWGFRRVVPYRSFACARWGSELKSSGLHSGHFAEPSPTASISSFNIVFEILFYVFGCFVCMYIHMIDMCTVPEVTRKRYKIPWNQN